MPELPSGQPQTRTGCLLMILFLVVCMLGAYAAVWLIFRLNGANLP